MVVPIEKWLVMALLTVVSILVGLLPYALVRNAKSRVYTESTKYKYVLTIFSCFGAGVLFSTCLLHLLPEVRETFQGIPSVWTTFDAHFPVAEAVVICGFCLIYLVEEIAHFIVTDEHHGHHPHIHAVVRHNSIVHALPVKKEHICGTQTRGSMISRSFNPEIVVQVIDEYNDEPYQDKKRLAVHKPVDTCSVGSTEESVQESQKFAASLRTFLALVALSFHAIMEGIAVGVQESSSVWVMFGAVASHKFVISFCMGMELVATNTKLLGAAISIIVFAVLSPIGIIIGSVLTSENSTDELPVTVIEALACGTILYVVFFEILNRERERKNESMRNSKVVGFVQFAALFVGLVAMGCLVTLMHQSHGDHDGSEDDHQDHDHDHDH